MRKMKLLLEYARGIKVKFVIGSLLLTLSSFAAMYTIFLEKEILDRIASAFSIESFKMMVTQYLLAACVIFITGLLGSYALLKVNTMFRLNQYEKLISKIYELEIQNFASYRMGTFLNYFMTDIPNISMIYIYILPEIILEIVSIIYIALFFWKVNKRILILALLFIFLCQLVNKYFVIRIQKLNLFVSKEKEKVTIRIGEGIEAYDEISVFSANKWFCDLMNHSLKKLYNAQVMEINFSNKAFVAGEILKWIPQIVVLIILGIDMLKGKCSLGSIYLTYRYIKQLSDYSNTIYNLIQDVNRRMAYLERFDNFMKKYIKKEIELIDFNEKIHTLNFNNITFAYDDKQIFLNQSFTVNIGESSALVGKSGCGKSTLLKFLLKFYQPDFGTILINGIDLNKIHIGSWYGNIAVVMQEPYIFKDTIRNNIIMNLNNISDEYIYKICKIVCIDEFVYNKPDKLDFCLEAKGKNISGGQKQRIALARALIRNAQILLLDEATSALDVETEKKVITGILRYREGLTTLMVAHRKETIKLNENIIKIS